MLMFVVWDGRKVIKNKMSLIDCVRFLKVWDLEYGSCSYVKGYSMFINIRK